MIFNKNNNNHQYPNQHACVLQCILLMAYFRDYDASDYFIVNTSKPLIWELRKPIHHQTLYVENNSSFNAVLPATTQQSTAELVCFDEFHQATAQTLYNGEIDPISSSKLYTYFKTIQTFSLLRKLFPCKFADDVTVLA